MGSYSNISMNKIFVIKTNILLIIALLFIINFYKYKLSAQNYDDLTISPSLLRNLKWTNIVPERGGRSMEWFLIGSVYSLMAN